MKIWKKEDVIKDKNIDISKGIHRLFPKPETIKEFFKRVPNWDVKYCDFCEKKFHIFKDNKKLVVSNDIGFLKCNEYSCHSYICLSCAKKIVKKLELKK